MLSTLVLAAASTALVAWLTSFSAVSQTPTQCCRVAAGVFRAAAKGAKKIPASGWNPIPVTA